MEERLTVGLLLQRLHVIQTVREIVIGSVSKYSVGEYRGNDGNGISPDCYPRSLPTVTVPSSGRTTGADGTSGVRHRHTGWHNA